MRSHAQVTGLVSSCILALALFGCGGGGGGGGGGTNADTTAPTIVSVTPAADATGVAINTTVSVTFSEAVDCATLTTSSFTLTDGANAVSGSVACDGSNATFTPSANLAGNAAHTATITTAATDIAGNALAANYSWGFTTGAAPDTTPPTVSTVSPANGAVDVAPGSNVEATFSEAMNCTTVTATSFTLAGAGAIDGSIACSGSTVAFAPTFGLPESATMNATLTTAAMDSAGNALTADYTWSFTTRARAWSAAATIVQTDLVSWPVAGFDAQGNAIAAWQENTPTGESLIATARLTPDGNWTTTYISNNVYPAPSDPQIVVTPSGNAVVAWLQEDEGTGQPLLWANVYTADAGWSGAAPLENADGDTWGFALAGDADGNVMAVWERTVGADTSILSKRYAAASGTWGATAPVESRAEAAAYPAIVFAGSEAFAVWRQSNGTSDRLWYNRHDGSGWGTAIEAESGGTVPNDSVLKADAAGNVTAVWRTHDGTRYNLWANRFDADSDTWGTAQALESLNFDLDSLNLTVDTAGNALAVWKQSDGTAARIWSSRRGANADTWNAAETIDGGTPPGDPSPSVPNNLQQPRLAMNAQGSAVAIWQYYDVAASDTRVAVNRYLDGSWGTPLQPLETMNDAYNHGVAIDTRGDAIALWRMVNTTTDDLRWSHLQ